MHISEQNLSYDYDSLIEEFENDVAEFHWKPTDIIYIDRDTLRKVVGYLEYSPIIQDLFLKVAEKIKSSC